MNMNTPSSTARRGARVEINSISLAYGATRVLRDVSLDIIPGEFFALLGPSGSGKSTLLRLIAGFNQAQSGTLRVDGADITGIPPWRRDIGMVFQNYALWPHMTVAQNVAFGLEERRLPRAEVLRRAAAALELVGLAEYGPRYPSQLSGGQQQRVAVARTIAIEPKVLLLDEPLSNLDAKLRVHMRVELLALQRKLGITTIFVTHDQEEALSISDRVAVLDGGVIQQVGTPMELYDRPANRFIAGFVGTINLLRGTASRGAAGVVFESPLTGKFNLMETSAATGAVEIAFRPHTLSLAAPGAEGTADRVWLKGNIVEREFLGEFVRYRINVEGNEIIADRPHYADVVDYAPGNAVAVGLQPSQVRLLPI
jgi:iron(III) transport system ATP-binding protein